MPELSHSDLLQLQQDLTQLDWETIAVALDSEIKNLLHLMQHNSGLQDPLQKDLDQLHAIMRRFQMHHNGYQRWLNDQLKQQRAALLNQSQMNFGNLEIWSTDAQMSRAQRWQINQVIKDDLAALIGKHASWKFPVLYYKPNTAELTRLLIHGDPFYVVDHQPNCIDHVAQHLPHEMRRKLLYYSINALPVSIPDHSVGLIVSWNNFRFQSVESIIADVKILSKKLLPGGCILFDFNDGETVQGSRDAESNLMSFVCKGAIIQELKNNNVALLNYTHKPDYHISYMLAQHVGKIPTVPLVNKIALVRKNPDESARIEQEEAALRLYYENLTDRLQQQLKTHRSRDEKLNQLQLQQRTDYSRMLQEKMNQALAHLTSMLDQYGRKHRASLHAMINVAKLAYAMGRTRDTQNIYRQTVDLIKHVQPNQELQEAFEQLEALVRNIDQNIQIN